MKKIKVSEATGRAIRWLVAKAEGALAPLGNLHFVGHDLFIGVGGDLGEPGQWVMYRPDEDWSQGGPIIEREEIGVCYYHEADGWEVPNWAAWRTDIEDRVPIMGETPLIAAMRCYVASKLGYEVEVPEGLLS